jgi:hypothetical protein
MDVLKDVLTAVALGLVCSTATAVPVTFESPCSQYGEHGARLGCPYVKRAESTLAAKLSSSRLYLRC